MLVTCLVGGSLEAFKQNSTDMNSMSSRQDPHIPGFNQRRGDSWREGREKSGRPSGLCWCFCLRRVRAGSQINYCPSSGFGEGSVCLVWEAPDTLVLTEVLQRLGPVGLRGPSSRIGGESSFIPLHAQGCPWTESGGLRRREAGLSSQRPLTCFYRLSARVPRR